MQQVVVILEDATVQSVLDRDHSKGHFLRMHGIEYFLEGREWDGDSGWPQQFDGCRVAEGSEFTLKTDRTNVCFSHNYAPFGTGTSNKAGTTGMESSLTIFTR